MNSIKLAPLEQRWNKNETMFDKKEFKIGLISILFLVTFLSFNYLKGYAESIVIQNESKTVILSNN